MIFKKFLININKQKRTNDDEHLNQIKKYLFSNLSISDFMYFIYITLFCEFNSQVNFETSHIHKTKVEILNINI